MPFFDFELQGSKLRAEPAQFELRKSKPLAMQKESSKLLVSREATTTLCKPDSTSSTPVHSN